jgi:3-hydroxybutyryl-CoA dehydrogenase
MDCADIQRIGILGAGLMGHGIAQVFAGSGFNVHIYDADPAALDTVATRVTHNFQPFIELNLATSEDRDQCLQRIHLSRSLEAMCDGPQVIVEAIAEDMALKQKLFAEIEQYTAADTILASNTSALSISAIGASLRHKGRFLGSHFWNPPHIIPA